MVKRTGGFRSKTRHKLRKHPRDRGKISTTRLLQQLEIGDSVIIKQDPAVHKMMPNPKYRSQTGKVVGKQGRVYVIAIKDGGKTKYLQSAPIHLIKVK